jgi:pimeloyl-ACP methyl ester carboxylesterase
MAAVALIASLVAGAIAPDPAGQPTAGRDRDGVDASPSATSPPSPDPSPELEVSRASCPGVDLTCERMTVPIDHERPEAGTMRVVFGRHEAEDERRGTLVIATGGPGSSGLEAAPYYLGILPPALLDRFDVVFFDQRGVGRSSALDCRLAELAIPRPDARDEPSPAYETATAAWVTSCLDEADVDDAAALAAYDTWSVADDIEAYRRHVAAETIHIYGESYGTEVAQHYAARYPNRVAGLVLDGPVDTALDGFAFIEGQLGAFWDVTLDSLSACAEDPACTSELGERPVDAWTALLDELAAAPRSVDYAISATETSLRELTLYDVATMTLAMMYAEYERMLFLRALADAADGDSVPMLTLGYLLTGVDPATLEPLVGPPRATALFYAIRCRNYADVADRSAGVDGLRRVHAALAEAGNRYADLVWDDLACLHGFTELGSAVERPGPPSGDFSTLVLTATADPATPAAWAEGIAAEASDGYLIRTVGGRHVTFGSGLRCPDDLVIDFLMYDELPRDVETECEGYVIEPYMPRLQDSLAAYADVGEALVALEQELFSRPEYYLWDGTATGVPCEHGGWVSLRWDGADAFRLEDCQLFEGWPLSGTIRYGVDGKTTMKLTAPNASLTYESSADWRVTISGTLDGQPVDIDRQVAP